MLLILVVDGRESALFPDHRPDMWRHRFDRVLDGTVEDALGRYDVVVPADHLREAPRIGDAVNAAFLCTELDALDHALTLDLPGDILFRPSAVAWLDRYRQLRPTLIAARFLDAGHVIVAEDLAEEVGGMGVSSDLKPTVIGRAVLYDLAKGVAIDFGMIGDGGKGTR